jgi:hypothetical protein
MSKTFPRALAVILVVGGSGAGAGCWYMIPPDGPRRSIFDRDCERNDAGQCLCTSNDWCAGKTPVCDPRTRLCVGCSDGIQNGNETGVDCGGPDCGACAGEPCSAKHACAGVDFCDWPWGVCCSTPCAPKCESCSKRVTGHPDGTCAPIPLGTDPFGQCRSRGGCGVGGECRCEDAVKNGDESDVDCGGRTCPPCKGGRACITAADCAGEAPACVNGACCQSVCDALCKMCDPGGRCVDAPAGYLDSRCTGDTACAPHGGCASKAGAPCSENKRCLSGLCKGGVCAKSSPMKPCSTTADCALGTCKNYVCQ